MVKNPLVSPGDLRDMGLIPGSEGSPGERKWQLTLVFLPGNPMDSEAWQSYVVHRVAESQT